MPPCDYIIDSHQLILCTSDNLFAMDFFFFHFSFQTKSESTTVNKTKQKNDENSREKTERNGNKTKFAAMLKMMMKREKMLVAIMLVRRCSIREYT